MHRHTGALRREREREREREERERERERERQRAFACVNDTEHTFENDKLSRLLLGHDTELCQNFFLKQSNQKHYGLDLPLVAARVSRAMSR